MADHIHLIYYSSKNIFLIFFYSKITWPKIKNYRYNKNEFVAFIDFLSSKRPAEGVTNTMASPYASIPKTPYKYWPLYYE